MIELRMEKKRSNGFSLVQAIEDKTRKSPVSVRRFVRTVEFDREDYLA